jgi:leader peptidase (prepilin peptidase) / N-methyltransferase
MIERIFAFWFGAIVGSFLNVCIHRMPLEQSVVKPRSFCPHCKHTIPWFDNIPFFSFLLLGGKCRFCKQRISPRYIIVELITALSFLLFYNIYGFSFQLVYYLVFVAGLIVATFVDIQHRIIPDEISLGGIVAGLVFNGLQGLHFSPFSYSFRPVFNSFLGVIIGGGIIYMTGVVFDLVYFKLLKNPPIQGETESMGGGDVKLLAMIGAFLGWQNALLTFFGAAIGVVNLLSKKDHTIPYGPFLSLASLLALFWADNIIRLIFLVR